MLETRSHQLCSNIFSQRVSLSVVLATSIMGSLLSCSDHARAFEASSSHDERQEGVIHSEAPADEALFNGRWEPCRRKIDRDIKRFDQRLDEVMTSVPWYKRVFVRARLKRFRRHPERPERLTLRVDATRIAMDVDSKNGKFHYHVEAPRSGEVVQVPDWEGDLMDTSFTVAGRRMRQHFVVKQGEGVRTNVSTLDESGDVLRMEVTIEAREHLERPFVYVFHYCRAEG